MSLIERALAKSGAGRSGHAVGSDSGATTAPQAPLSTGMGAPGEWVSRADLPPADFQVEAGGAISAMWQGTADREIYSRFYSLRREILDVATELRDQNIAPVVLVTSAIPSDGKTFVSLGVARVLASVREFTTTLVDADLIRRTLSGIWGLEGQPGLAECIREEAYLPSLLRRTHIEGVEVIAAGRPTTEAAEELASMKIRGVFESMATAGSRRLFVVDAPPALSVSETASLARYAHLVVLVVRANATPVPAVTEAVTLLQGCRCLIVLNGTSAESAWIGGGYYKVPYER